MAAAAVERVQQIPGTGGLYDPMTAVSVWPSQNPTVPASNPNRTQAWNGVRTGHEAALTEEEMTYMESVYPSITVMALTTDDWYRQVAPYRLLTMAQNKISWSTTTFEPGLATQVPELGIARLVRHKTEAFEASLLRHAAGMILEGDFMSTTQGRQTYLSNLLQLAETVTGSANMDCIVTLLACRNSNERMIREKGLYQGLSPVALMQREAFRFAPAQKMERLPVEKVDADVDQMMKNWQGKADTWIFPPQVFTLLRLTKPNYTDYRIAGQAGPALLAQSAASPAGFLNQSRVFIAHDFILSSDYAPFNPMAKRYELGEYYLSKDPEDRPHIPYNSAERNLQIFSTTTGKFEELNVFQMLRVTGLFNIDSGDPIPLQGIPNAHNPQIDPKQSLTEDIFNYQLNGTERTAKYWGEVDEKYVSAQDKVLLSKSFFSALENAFGKKHWRRHQANIEAGIDLINVINDIVWSPTIDAALQTLFVGVAFETLPSNVQQLTQSVQTGFTTMTPNQITQLLPGFGSYAGLKALAQFAGPTLNKEAKVAKKFVSSIDALVSKLNSITPSSIFLQPENSAPWWRHANASSVFTENLLMGVVNPPAFVQIPGGVSLAQTTAAVRQIVENLTGNFWTDPDFALIGSDPAHGQDYAVSLAFLGVLAPIVGSTRAQILTDFGDGATLTTYPTYGDLVDQIYTFIDNIGDVAIEANAARAISTTETAARGPIYLAFARMQGLAARTNLLLSANYAASIVQPLSNGVTVFAVPADPRNMGQKIDTGDLDNLTRHLPGRVGLTYAERQAASTQSMVQNLPAWQNSRIGNANTNIVHSPLGNTLVAKLTAQKLVNGNGIAGNVFNFSAASQFETVQAESPIISKLDELINERAQFVGARAGAFNVPYDEFIGLDNGDLRIPLSGNFVKSWGNIGLITSNMFERAFARLWDSLRINLFELENMIRNNIRCVLNLLVLRLHITVGVWTAIKLLAGASTVITAVKEGRFEVGRDTITQAFGGTLTWHSKVVVLNEANVCVYPAFAIYTVFGGMDMAFINPEFYIGGTGRQWTGSIIVLPLSKSDKIGAVFSAMGDLSSLPEFNGYGLVPDYSSQYSTMIRALKTWGWAAVRAGTMAMIQQHDQPMLSSFPNVMAMQGTSIHPDPKTLNYTVVREGKGHLEGLIYPNCIHVLNGNNVEVKTAAWPSNYTILHS